MYHDEIRVWIRKGYAGLRQWDVWLEVGDLCRWVRNLSRIHIRRRWCLRRICNFKFMTINSAMTMTLGHQIWLVSRDFGGGGDQGDPGKESAQPKPLEASCLLKLLEGLPGLLSCTKLDAMVPEDNRSEGRGGGTEKARDLGHGVQFHQGGSSRWEIEVYKEEDNETHREEDQEDVLEIDPEEEEEEIAQKFLAIAVYYSRKRFDAKVLFAEMLNA
jgi:hypothetical protein